MHNDTPWRPGQRLAGRRAGRAIPGGPAAARPPARLLDRPFAEAVSDCVPA